MSRGCCKEDDLSDTCFMNKNGLPPEQAAQDIYINGCYEAIKEDLQEEVIALCVVLFLMAIVEVSTLAVESA